MSLCAPVGLTVIRPVYGLVNNGYQVIFAQNDKSDDEAMQVVLNKKYATRVVDMIEERISGDF